MTRSKLPQTEISDPLMTTGDVAEYMRVNRSTVRNWVDAGHIEHIKTPGGHVRIRYSEVVRIMNGNRGAS